MSVQQFYRIAHSLTYSENDRALEIVRVKTTVCTLYFRSRITLPQTCAIHLSTGNGHKIQIVTILDIFFRRKKCDSCSLANLVGGKIPAWVFCVCFACVFVKMHFWKRKTCATHFLRLGPGRRDLWKQTCLLLVFGTCVRETLQNRKLGLRRYPDFACLKIKGLLMHCDVKLFYDRRSPIYEIYRFRKETFRLSICWAPSSLLVVRLTYCGKGRKEVSGRGTKNRPETFPRFIYFPFVVNSFFVRFPFCPLGDCSPKTFLDFDFFPSDPVCRRRK